MKRLLPPLLLLLLLTGCAAPTSQRYDHPYPKAHMYLYRVSPAELAAICGDAVGLRGCAVLGYKMCSVYLRNDLSIAWTHDVRRHERKHCNGWPGHHPL